MLIQVKPASEGGCPVRQDMLTFGAPMIEDAEVAEVVATLRSGWLGTGPKVHLFQDMFREQAEAKHALALNSCTAGLHLSLLVAGVGPGDEVIVPSITFCATANVVVHVGATPVLVDVDRQTMNLTIEYIKAAFTERTKAIIPVHMAGRPCVMDEILPFARERGLFVIEDAAHAIEAVCQGEKVGSLGDASCFSFYVTKNLVTGEGGMVTTPHAAWSNKIQMMSQHGMSKGAWKRYSDEGFQHYQVTIPGFKYNMTDMQASLGIHQLPRLPEYLKRRESIWKQYDAAFADLPVICPVAVREGDVHARHLYTLLLDLDDIKVDRDQIMNALYEENIGTGIHFVGLHMHLFYQERYGYRAEDCPNALWISERTISLPLTANLADNDVDDVIAAVVKVIRYYQK
ncbi:MAG: DegT/DnrJ/EryC1/StrS family aminotransferase [Mariprofundaceae bacterium]|nr:DegT/DnrJ/EryC1/StrS family aminotransferase [Mariprofundaceae bacterium]